MTKIQLKRGLEKDLPILSSGEPGFSTDTGKLFIGSPNGNVQILSNIAGVAAPNTQSWISSDNQDTFTISNGHISTDNSIIVFVGGIVQPNITLLNNTTFQLPESLSAGTNVYAIWFDVPSGNGSNQSEIDITLLKNYQEDVATPIANLAKGVSEYEWTAAAGQLSYVLPSGQTYDVNSKWLEVFVGGAPIPDSQLQKDSSSQFTLLIDSSKIKNGMIVFARWTQSYIPATSGHNITHQLGGTDEIDITKLKNFNEQVATPLAQNTNKIDGTYNVIEYGASPSKSTTDNKTTLQNAIADVDSKGGGRIIIPYNIQYGFNRTNLTTHPDLSACVNDMVVMDFSKGNSYTDPSRDGAQVRIFSKTGGQLGYNDGNGQWIRAKWAPYFALSHDDSTADNRRANYWLARDGVMMWGIGQGSQSGTGLTDDQKTDFVIMGNNINGGTGLTNLLNILKTNGFFGFNTNGPNSDFHFVTLRGTSQDGTFRIQNPASKTGNLNFALQTKNKNRITTLYDADGSIKITNGTGASNVYILSDAGNGYFAKGVSGNSFATASRPTGTDLQVGTMIFDTTLGKPIWYKGSSVWVDATGATV